MATLVPAFKLLIPLMLALLFFGATSLTSTTLVRAPRAIPFEHIVLLTEEQQPDGKVKITGTAHDPDQPSLIPTMDVTFDFEALVTRISGEPDRLSKLDVTVKSGNTLSRVVAEFRDTPPAPKEEVRAGFGAVYDSIRKWLERPKH